MKSKFIVITMMILILFATSAFALDLKLDCAETSVVAGNDVSCDLSFTDSQSILLLGGKLSIPSTFENDVKITGLPVCAGEACAFKASYDPATNKLVIDDQDKFTGASTTKIATLTFTSKTAGAGQFVFTIDPANTMDAVNYDVITFANNIVNSVQITTTAAPTCTPGDFYECYQSVYYKKCNDEGTGPSGSVTQCAFTATTQQLCSATLEKCVECLVDSDCSAGTCNVATGNCEVPPATCTPVVATACADGELCNKAGSCVAAGGTAPLDTLKARISCVLEGTNCVGTPGYTQGADNLQKVSQVAKALKAYFQ